MRTTVPKSHHGMRWSPESQAGAWTLTLAGLALGVTVVLAVAFSLGLEPAEDFTDNWLLTGAGAAILAGGAASVVTGGVALIGRNDRSWLVLSAAVLGALVAGLMLQQAAEGLGWLGS